MAEVDGLALDQQLMKDLCAFARLAPSQVAKRAGVAATTILRPFGGTATTRVSQPTLDKLRAAFPAFPGWRNEFPDQVGMVGEHRDPYEVPGELVYIRQVDISYAMGEGSEVEQYPATGLVPFNLAFIRAVSNANTESLFIATGHGDSMEPTLLRSDLVMVDTSQNQVRQQDQVWALTYAGGGMVKRLRRILGDRGEQFLILSDNPAVPPQAANVDDVHIVGKVVWVGRRM